MIVIFGSNGMLGNYMVHVLSHSDTIIALKRNDFNIETDPWEKLYKILHMYKPTVIINCAGLIPQRNLKYIKPYYRINSVFPHKLQNYCNKYPCKLIHITTDCVFSGDKGNYNEAQCPDPVNTYGRSKYLGEPLDACVIRTSIIGEEINNKRSLLEWVKVQTIINGFLNHIWNGVTCLKLSEIVQEIIQKKLFWKGIRHIHSPNSVSKFHLCKIIRDIYKLNINILSIDAPTKIDRTLLTLYPTFTIESIEDQLKKQKEFHLCKINI
jgi:dTDP-4-dehydrorhamnose reductase